MYRLIDSLILGLTYMILISYTMHQILSILLVIIVVSNAAKYKFNIYWNIPTFMCHKYNIFFNVSKYGIIQNDDDIFRGDKVLILYDPGSFPSFFSTPVEFNYTQRNEGLPQLGDLNLHLNFLRKDIETQVPNKDFSGVAVIDFESWRPILRQNWGNMHVYRKRSYDLERTLHPTWSKRQNYEEAKKNFEHHARRFMQKSLELARNLRPRGLWGYYAFPYCFNYILKNKKYSCPRIVKDENDRLTWLFESSDVLYPSLYMSKYHKLSNTSFKSYEKYEFIRGRLLEAGRMVKHSKSRKPLVMPYVWYLYQDSKEYLSVEDLLYSLGTPRILGQQGVILWGSSDDLNTADKCLRMRHYVNNILGPLSRLIREIPVKYLRNRIQGVDQPDSISTEDILTWITTSNPLTTSDTPQLDTSTEKSFFSSISPMSDVNTSLTPLLSTSETYMNTSIYFPTTDNYPITTPLSKDINKDLSGELNKDGKPNINSKSRQLKSCLCSIYLLSIVTYLRTFILSSCSNH